MAINNFEDLRNSGLFTIGSTTVCQFNVDHHSVKQIILERKMTVLPGEIWGIKSVECSVAADDDVSPVVYEIISHQDPEGVFLFRAKSETFREDTEKFLGHLLGPFEAPCEIAVRVSTEKRAFIFATATLERMNPPSLWVAPAAPNFIPQLLPMPSEAPAPAMTLMGEREVFVIDDPNAEEDEEGLFLEDRGYHKLPNGKWHHCPKCMDLLHHGDQSGGLEILQGGEAIVKVKAAKIEREGSPPKEEELEVVDFIGGAPVSDEKMQEMKMESQNNPATIRCGGCGAEGSEKMPPICNPSCPMKRNNDIIFSSWHRGPNGKCHYCQTCVNLIEKSLGIPS